MSDSPLSRDLVQPAPTVVEDRLEVPTRPGLGIELDESAVKRFRVA
jgi:L-alanine-DL-glutamate epimerase-like enolase superfamily enzyme